MQTIPGISLPSSVLKHPRLRLLVPQAATEGLGAPATTAARLFSVLFPIKWGHANLASEPNHTSSAVLPGGSPTPSQGKQTILLWLLHALLSPHFDLSPWYIYHRPWYVPGSVKGHLVSVVSGCCITLHVTPPVCAAVWMGVQTNNI